MIIREHCSLRQLNTLGFDVNARVLIELASPDDIAPALEFSRTQKLPIIVLGEGSNVVLTQDLNAVVLHPTFFGLSTVGESADHWLVKIAAGTHWHQAVLETLKLHYYGLENLSLIPGLVGAAPIQNIGAYGVELCDIFDSLEAVELKSGEQRKFTKQECQFGYRESVFKQQLRDQYLISSITLRLHKKPQLILNYAGIEQELDAMHITNITPAKISEAVCRLRQRKLPDPKQIGNAGSFFKNPLVSIEKFAELKKSYTDIVGYDAGNDKKIAAGWLIEKAGWKGRSLGNVAVHDKQALVLVNPQGKGNGAELMQLAAEIKNAVQNQFGVLLEIEPRIY